MHLIKIGVAALNQIPLDWRGNTSRIIEALSLAKKEGVQFLGLPEMVLSGYGCEDAYFAPGTRERALAALEAVLPHTEGMVVNFGLPLQYQGTLFNAIIVVSDGDIIAVVPKKFLAGDGVHYEPRWFKEWPSGFVDRIAREELRAPDLKLQRKNLETSVKHSPNSPQKNVKEKQDEFIPIGDLCFQWKDIRFGYEICEEAWVARRPGSHLAEHSIDLIFNPSASHFAFGKNEVRKRFVLEGSRAFSCVYAYSNLLGNEAGRLIYDGSLFIASNGELINESQRFSFKEMQMISSVVDLNLNRIKRQQTSSFNPVQAQFEQNEKTLSKALKIVEITNQNLFSNQARPSFSSSPSSSAAADSPFPVLRASTPTLLPALSKNEEFLQVVSLGLFDYLRKSQSKGFAISISGGTDSSVVAVLCASALKLALGELGVESFLQRFSYIADLQVLRTLRGEELVQAVLSKMVHGVYQATQNSSKETQNAASELAKALGIKYSEWSVEAIKSQYETLMVGIMGRPLSWVQDDLALQNIQARVRAPGVWMLANLQGFLLLATSNRSEAALGYATMDGDTAGGLSPIAGVDKAFLSQWIRWMGGVGIDAPAEVIPELKLVLEIEPTAELRPQTHQQIDEKDLMPYKLLDFIERHLMIDRLSPLDLMPVLMHEYPQYTKVQLRDWLILFLKLWTRNQWKRERFAPTFHLDAESLDPKTWCRFPILSKSFELDIEQLEKEY